MTQLNLNNYHFISYLESELITHTINNWRLANNLNKLQYLEINNNNYKYSIKANYRGLYFNFSEILYLILTIWKTQKNKKPEYNTCMNNDINNYYIYYTIVNHNFYFIFLFN